MARRTTTVNSIPGAVWEDSSNAPSGPESNNNNNNRQRDRLSLQAPPAPASSPGLGQQPAHRSFGMDPMGQGFPEQVGNFAVWDSNFIKKDNSATDKVTERMMRESRKTQPITQPIRRSSNRQPESHSYSPPPSRSSVQGPIPVINEDELGFHDMGWENPRQAGNSESYGSSQHSRQSTGSRSPGPHSPRRTTHASVNLATLQAKDSTVGRSSNRSPTMGDETGGPVTNQAGQNYGRFEEHNSYYSTGPAQHSPQPLHNYQDNRHGAELRYSTGSTGTRRTMDASVDLSSIGHTSYADEIDSQGPDQWYPSSQQRTDERKLPYNAASTSPKRSPRRTTGAVVDLARLHASDASIDFNSVASPPFGEDRKVPHNAQPTSPKRSPRRTTGATVDLARLHASDASVDYFSVTGPPLGEEIGMRSPDQRSQHSRMQAEARKLRHSTAANKHSPAAQRAYSDMRQISGLTTSHHSVGTSAELSTMGATDASVSFNSIPSPPLVDEMGSFSPDQRSQHSRMTAEARKMRHGTASPKPRSKNPAPDRAYHSTVATSPRPNHSPVGNSQHSRMGAEQRKMRHTTAAPRRRSNSPAADRAYNDDQHSIGPPRTRRGHSPVPSTQNSRMNAEERKFRHGGNAPARPRSNSPAAASGNQNNVMRNAEDIKALYGIGSTRPRSQSPAADRRFQNSPRMNAEERKRRYGAFPRGNSPSPEDDEQSSGQPEELQLRQNSGSTSTHSSRLDQEFQKKLSAEERKSRDAALKVRHRRGRSLVDNGNNATIHEDDMDSAEETEGGQEERPGAFAYSHESGMVRRTKGEMTETNEIPIIPIRDNNMPSSPPNPPGFDSPPIPGQADFIQEKMPEESKHSKLKWIVPAAVLLIVGAVLGVVLGPSKTEPESPSPTPQPTEAPTVDVFAEWRGRLEKWTDESVLKDTSSPQWAAMNWLANEDLMISGVTDDEIIDIRYSLAALFFATEGTQWKSSEGFVNPEVAECDWDFVTCNEDGSIIRLEIAGNSLRGTLPEEIKILTSLDILDFSMNGLVGTIPSLETLVALGELNLASNFLSGSIPLVGNSVRKMIFEDNRLSGNLVLPPGLQTLHTLDVALNTLTGTIPESLGDMPNLKDLFLSHNRFSGTVPVGKNWTSLNILDCQANFLTGTVPVADMEQLRVLLCGNNDLAENAISWDLFHPPIGLIELQAANLATTLDGIENLANLRSLTLVTNKLSGTIPAGIGSLTRLTNLELASNFLEGSLPKELGKLTGLVKLDLLENDLTGTVPTELGALPSLRYASFGINSFDSTDSDVEFMCSIASLGTLFGPDCLFTADCSCCDKCG